MERANLGTQYAQVQAGSRNQGSLHTGLIRRRESTRLWWEANVSLCRRPLRPEGGSGLSQRPPSQWIILARILALGTKQKPGTEHQASRAEEHPG